MKKGLLFVSLLFFYGVISAQELVCKVQVVSPKVQLTNKQVFTTLQNAVIQFMNNKKWTDDVFAQNEKIECSMMIEITSIVGTDEYKATLQLQTSRPVYNSDYSSPVLMHRDEEIQFKYREFESLEYQENQNLSQLTSLLAFYAYVMIGFDFDTYSPEGGTPYFQQANNILNLNLSNYGWDRRAGTSNKNRFFLMDNILNNRFKPLRSLYYNYHLKGLDAFYTNAEKGRQEITASLTTLQDLVRILPNSMFFKVFFNSKQSELIEIYKGASPNEKVKIIELLGQLDPANKAKYEGIR